MRILLIPNVSRDVIHESHWVGCMEIVDGFRQAGLPVWFEVLVPDGVLQGGGENYRLVPFEFGVSRMSEEVAPSVDLYRLLNIRSSPLDFDVVLNQRTIFAPTLKRLVKAKTARMNVDVPIVNLYPQVKSPSLCKTGALTFYGEDEMILEACSVMMDCGVVLNDYEKENLRQTCRAVLAPALLRDFDRRVYVLWINGIDYDTLDKVAAYGEQQKHGTTVMYGGRLNCLVPDTLVWSDNGLKEIGDMRAGDNVVSRDGHLCRVSRVYKGKYEGKLIRLKAAYLPSVMMTPEHYVWVQPWGKRRKYIEQYVTENGKKVSRCRNVVVKYEPRWMRANDLMNAICAQKVKSDLKRIRYDVVLPFDRREHDLEELDGGLCWLVGLFAGDGSIAAGGRALEFRLGPDQDAIADKIDVIARKLGVRTHRRVRIDKRDGSSVLRVLMFSTSMCRFMRRFVTGKKAFLKELTPEIMCLPAAKQVKVIEGLDDSDGCAFTVRPRSGSQLMYSSFCSSSRKLALQYQMLCLRTGEIAGISSSPPTDSVLNCRILHGKRIWHAFVTGAARDGLVDCGQLSATIKCVDEVDYDGEVVDMSIDGGRCYVTQSGLVHNSMQKRFPHAAQIMAEVKKHRPEWRYLVTTPEADKGKWEEYPFEWIWRCNRDEFWKEASMADVSVYCAVDEGVGVCNFEMLMLGVVPVIMDARWVDENLPEYPFVASGVEDMARMVIWVGENVKKANEMVDPVRRWIRLMYSGLARFTGLYEFMRTMMPPLPKSGSLGSLIREAFDAGGDRVPASQLWKLMSELSESGREFGKPDILNRFYLRSLIASEGFVDLCDGPEPVFVRGNEV
jgi:hypothetical protein